jgi:heptosyltransferase-3
MNPVPQPASQRVLIYRLGSLGDHLVAMPCYRLIERVFPQAERCLLTNVPVAAKAAAAEGVLRGSGVVSEFMTYSAGERGLSSLLGLVRQVRRWKPDVLVYLAGARGLKAARRDQWFFRACGVKRVIGLPLTEDLQLSRRLGDRNGAPWYEAEAARLARCLAELGDAELEADASWSPGLTVEEHAQAADLLLPLAPAGPTQPFFAMSLGTKVQSNHWTLEHWTALAARMGVEFPQHALVMLGAPDERAECDSVLAVFRGDDGSSGQRGLNLCGSCSPRVSAAVMQRAALVLAHDSGPAHLAAAVSAPLLGIYGARMLPGTWTPRGVKTRVLMHWVSCGGCLIDTCIVERKRCILSITVDEAMAAVREQMAQWV